MQFHFHANQSHFHKNGFALRLAFKQRHKGSLGIGLLNVSSAPLQVELLRLVYTAPWEFENAAVRLALPSTLSLLIDPSY